VRFALLTSFKLPAPRIVLATMLVLALVSGIAPFNASSSPSNLCTMACCAGKPPHEAGACAGVACHADFSARKRRPKPEPAAHCEMSKHVAAQRGREMMRLRYALLATPSSHQHLQGKDQHSTGQPAAPQSASEKRSSVTAAVISNACRPDCGAGVFSSSSQNRQRDAVGLSYAEQPRPPSRAFLFISSHNLAKTLSVLCGKCVPRAPPILFS
jgi:hypothetical protein